MTTIKTAEILCVGTELLLGEVINTIGAGDALFSAFLHYYAKGMNPAECLKRAQVFAAAKIRVSGASRGFVAEQEVEEMLQWN